MQTHRNGSSVLQNGTMWGKVSNASWTGEVEFLPLNLLGPRNSLQQVARHGVRPREH